MKYLHSYTLHLVKTPKLISGVENIMYKFHTLKHTCIVTKMFGLAYTKPRSCKTANKAGTDVSF